MLKSGFTTGTAAAAAVKAALTRIVTGDDPDSVDILLLTGDSIRIPVHGCKQISVCRASATVIKDAGDDPDVTHRAKIGAIVTLCASEDFQKDLPAGPPDITITGGEGVGKVTLPGLEIPPGEAGHQPGPPKDDRHRPSKMFWENRKQNRTTMSRRCMLKSLFPKEGSWLKKP